MSDLMLKGEKGLQPSNVSEAMQLADMLSKSSIVPKDYQGNAGNVFVAMQWGAELGLAPMQAMQNIAVINGRPSIWGDSMLALVRGSGLLVDIKEEITDTYAICTVWRKGSEHPIERMFTFEDAKKAGLAGKSGPWTQYPKRMMQMRARSYALRDGFADVLRGVYSAEEAQDMPAERDMGRAEEVQPEKPTKKSRKAAATAALAIEDKTQEQAENVVPTVDLQTLIDQLHAVQTLDELKAIAEQAQYLTDEGHKEILRGKYKERQSELKNPPPIIDEDGVVYSTEETTEDIF